MFEVVFIFEVIFNFEVIFILIEVVFSIHLMSRTNLLLAASKSDLKHLR